MNGLLAVRPYELPLFARCIRRSVASCIVVASAVCVAIPIVLWVHFRDVLMTFSGVTSVLGKRRVCICCGQTVDRWSIRSGPVACELCRVGATIFGGKACEAELVLLL